MTVAMWTRGGLTPYATAIMRTCVTSSPGTDFVSYVHVKEQHCIEPLPPILPPALTSVIETCTNKQL